MNRLYTHTDMMTSSHWYDLRDCNPLTLFLARIDWHGISEKSDIFATN